MPRNDCRRPWLALTLILSLLVTQWLGIAHTIAHGNGLPEIRPTVIKTASLYDHQKSSGACAALDAATLGAGVPAATFAPALATLADGHVASPPSTGAHLSFTAHFSPRAPPTNA